MNICLRHKRHSINEKKRNSYNKQAKEDLNDIINKYFLCKSCGVLIDEKDENVLLKSHSKNFTPLREIKLLDMISYIVNQQDTRKIKIANSDCSKSLNNSLIKKYLAERSSLIQYLTRMVKQFKYTERTYFYTISIFDSIFAAIESQNIKFYDIKVDVILICSMLIAVKYSENDPRLPEYKDLFTRNSRIYFSERDLRNTEIICLKILNYNLTFINVYDYIDFFLMIGIVDKNEMSYNPDALEKINNQAFIITNTFISDNKSLIFSDLQIACSIIKLVRELNKFQIKWLNIYKELFFIEEIYFTECFDMLKSSVFKKKSSSNTNFLSASKNIYSSMNKINSFLYNNTPTYSDVNNNKNQSNSSNYLATYTSNNYYSNQNKFDCAVKNTEKRSSLSYKKTNCVKNDFDTENIIKKYSGDEKDEELIKILGNNNNKESLNTISNIQADDKNSNLNMITNASDKEIVQNFLNNNQDLNEKNTKSDLDTSNGNREKKIQSSDLNYVNEKNIFKKSEMLINKSSVLQKGSNNTTNKFENSSHTLKPKSNKNLKDDNFNRINNPNQSKKLIENADDRLLSKDNFAKSSVQKENIVNSNKFSLTDFNKTLNKKNRYSLTSNPAILNDILSKINLLENIEDKVLSLREPNDNRKSLEKIDEIQTNKKNSLKKSVTTKNSINKSNFNNVSNANKFNKLTQSKDIKSDKPNKKTNPIVKRIQNTNSKHKKFDSKRIADTASSHSNGFKTFQHVNGHLKKFSILHSLSNSDSFTNTSLNFSSNPDSRRMKDNKGDVDIAYANEDPKFEINDNNQLGIINEINNHQSFDLSVSIIPKNDKDEKTEKPMELKNEKVKVEKNAIDSLNNNNPNLNPKKTNDKKLNFDRKISNLRNEINNRLKEINGITLDIDKKQSNNEENNLESQSTRLKFNDLVNNFEANPLQQEKKESNFDKNAKDVFTNTNNFNQIFENNIKQLEEKFANIKKKIKVQNGNMDNKKETSDKKYYPSFANNLNFQFDDKKFVLDDKKVLGQTSTFLSGSYTNKASEINRAGDKNKFYDQFYLNNNYAKEDAVEDQLNLKNLNYSPGGLEKNINKITNYFKNNSIIKDERNKRNNSIKQINTDMSNFEMDLMNTEINYNNMLENLDTLENLDILKTEVPSSNKHFMVNNARYPIGNDVTLENIEDSLEKLTSLRRENKLINKNLVLDISEDLKTKSKKLRKEMEKFSRILETEISVSNNNISGNVTSTNFSQKKNYNNNIISQNSYKREDLKIKASNENNNSDAKHFKKINYDPRITKKFSFFKDSPSNAESKLQEKLMELSKPKQYNKAKTNKSQIDYNRKPFKDKPSVNNFSKIHRMKDAPNEIKINQLDSMSLSDIGKSLSNYNRCVTMKSESKIKNYYLDLMRNNNKITEQFRSNKSSTRQKVSNNKINGVNNINEFSNRNNILSNNFAKYSSVEFHSDFFSIENPNNGKNTFMNIFDSDNSTSKNVKSNLKTYENKVSNRDSEITINSMSISSSNNNLNNLAYRNTNINSNYNISIIENNNSLELNSADNRKTESAANHENHFKSKSNSNNIFEHLSKEKTRRANKDSNKEPISANNINRYLYANNNSKSITDFDFAFAKSRKMKIEETERAQNKQYLIDNLNSNVNSSVSERNNFFNLRNKNIDQLNENKLITSVFNVGGLSTLDADQTNFNNFITANNNNTNNNVDDNANQINLIHSSDNTKTLFDSINENPKKLKDENEQTEAKKENKKSIIDDSLLKNLKSSNYNSSNNFSISAKKKNNLTNFTNSNNFKYLNDLLNKSNNNNINSIKAENEKAYGFFSAEKNKLSHLNPELYIKTGKPNAPSFNYISGLNSNKNAKVNGKENSMNPALKKINELKNELSYYTNSNSTNTNKKPNNHLISNLNSNHIMNTGNIDLGNLISNSTSNGQVANSNFNFNFNFFNGPNINPQHSLQNISYNYLANLGNLENNNANLNANDNNLNLLMRLLDNKTSNNSNSGNNFKLGNLKSNKNNGNKFKFLNLNNLTTSNEFNSSTNNNINNNKNNNNLNLNSNKNKNLNNQKMSNKNNFNSMLDYPITTKNKNINYFNFDDNSKKGQLINDNKQN